MRGAIVAAVTTFAVAAQAAAQVDQVTIAGRAVDDPAAYDELLDEGEPADPAPRDAKRIEIVVQPTGFSGLRQLEYFPVEEVVHRRGEWVSVSDELAEQIEDALSDRAAEGRPSWPAYLSLFVLLGAGGTLVWLMWGRRRWRARAT